MIATRRKRTTIWLLGLGGLAAVLAGVETEDRAGGSFRLRPATRVELRAPVAGFLREVYFDEGDRVSPGAPVARLEVPGLESRLAQKQAELGEARARLRLLEIGPRPEEVAEQRRRVERARRWRDLAQRDLKRSHAGLRERPGPAREADRRPQRRAGGGPGRLSPVQGCSSAAGPWPRSRSSRTRGSTASARRTWPKPRRPSGPSRPRGRWRPRPRSPAARRSWPRPRPSCGSWRQGRGRRRSSAERPGWPACRKSCSHLEEPAAQAGRLQPDARPDHHAPPEGEGGAVPAGGRPDLRGGGPAGLEAEIALAEQDVARVRPGQADPAEGPRPALRDVRDPGGSGRASRRCAARCRAASRSTAGSTTPPTTCGRR